MEMGLKQAKKIVIDLGLVIECKEEELLPERLLCAWRMCRPDLTQTVNIDWGVCFIFGTIRHGEWDCVVFPSPLVVLCDTLAQTSE